MNGFVTNHAVLAAKVTTASKQLICFEKERIAITRSIEQMPVLGVININVYDFKSK